MSSVEEKLITAEEFLNMPDLGPCELVRGRIVTMGPPSWRHGWLGLRVGHIVQNYLDEHDIGRLSGLDTGVVTERGPDTVRGADVCYTSYTRLPANQEPDDYPELAPEIIWEVFSKTDRWKKVLAKVSEYLEAGVLIVCVVDPKRQCLVNYYPDRPEETLGIDDVWRAEDLLPGFELPVRRVFEGQKTSK